MQNSLQGCKCTLPHKLAGQRHKIKWCYSHTISAWSSLTVATRLLLLTVGTKRYHTALSASQAVCKFQSSVCKLRSAPYVGLQLCANRILLCAFHQSSARVHIFGLLNELQYRPQYFRVAHQVHPQRASPQSSYVRQPQQAW